MAQPWQRRKAESAKSYAAFRVYFQMPARDRSIDAAWRADSGQTDSAKRAHPSWFRWSTQHAWIERTAAYEQHLADQEQAKWEQRRRRLQERDWEQADALRAVVDAALPHAEQFIQRKTTTIRGTPTLVDSNGEVVRPGTPDREIVTLAFNITGLARVLTDASKLQRLTTGDPTERTEINDATDARERIAGRIAGIAQRNAAGGDTGGTDS